VKEEEDEEAEGEEISFTISFNKKILNLKII